MRPRSAQPAFVRCRGNSFPSLVFDALQGLGIEWLAPPLVELFESEPDLPRGEMLEDYPHLTLENLRAAIAARS